MIEPKFTDEQAQLTVNLLNQNKISSQKSADISSDAIDALMIASKKEAEKQKENNPT